MRSGWGEQLAAMRLLPPVEGVCAGRPRTRSECGRGDCRTSVQSPSLYSQRAIGPFAPLDDDWGGVRLSAYGGSPREPGGVTWPGRLGQKPGPELSWLCGREGVPRPASVLSGLRREAGVPPEAE